MQCLIGLYSVVNLLHALNRYLCSLEIQYLKRGRLSMPSTRMGAHRVCVALSFPSSLRKRQAFKTAFYQQGDFSCSLCST